MRLDRTKINKKNLTTIPKSIRNALKLKAGDHILWCIENEKVVVYKEVM